LNFAPADVFFDRGASILLTLVFPKKAWLGALPTKTRLKQRLELAAKASRIWQTPASETMAPQSS
jgi:hypothetical protein